jgi:hypothetical protein
MDAGGAQSLYLSQQFRRCVNRYGVVMVLRQIFWHPTQKRVTRRELTSYLLPYVYVIC